MHVLEHELVTNSDAENVVRAVGLDSIHDKIALPLVRCTSIVGDVVDTEIYAEVNLCLLNGFELADVFLSQLNEKDRLFYLPQAQTGCSQLRTNGCAKRRVIYGIFACQDNSYRCQLGDELEIAGQHPK